MLYVPIANLRESTDMQYERLILKGISFNFLQNVTLSINPLIDNTPNYKKYKPH